MSKILKPLILKRFHELSTDEIKHFALMHNLPETAKHAKDILAFIRPLDPFKQDNLVYLFSYLRTILPAHEVTYIHQSLIDLIESYHLIELFD
ncbi:hypothetical protein HMI01_06790 [Halolactibacillus miurensis]|uniref:Uncharacterized protein n=1 Tax=Halolactibacillus miurensis TaxID=306541 RepID=A0A1I6PQQ8_9BACI|nr:MULTISPECIES: DUF2624 family protein [Halolactibacillus]GEM03691.1 hypothetical protein HMI01_06790 [Halolactibacillus miurensis]SFS42524.1 hypothetical protein SAMN05421668_102139 [Halolactibacillus miurensis]